VLALMTPSTFVEVGPQGRPDHGKATVVSVDKAKVALFNLDGRIYALSDFCVRCGASLAAGMVTGTHVTCRQCSWRYDIISGRLIELPALATDRFEVKINDGHVLVSTEPSASLSR
jgi:3-phenylpropionate/trans-cinnamate dioxygenase ferredoxin component